MAPGERNLTIRRATLDDASRLLRLAALDSANPPRPPALVAESDGELLAAISLRDGRSIAHPFQPTADLVTLLRVRGEQLAHTR